MKAMSQSAYLTYIFGIISLILCSSVVSEEKLPPYRLYLNADQSNNAASGQAIELGIRTAFEQVGWKLGGYPVELIIKDHHGSSPRSRFHLEQFLTDPQALLVYGGLHSPPLINDRDFINKEEILTLVPWAAASPITRPSTTENWIYRLSLDDSKASKVIIDHAVKVTGCHTPVLLLEETSWGIANKKNMIRALEALNIKTLNTLFFK